MPTRSSPDTNSIATAGSGVVMPFVMPCVTSFASTYDPTHCPASFNPLISVVPTNSEIAGAMIQFLITVTPHAGF